MELSDTWNINRYICKVLHNARLDIYEHWQILKYTNPSTYYFFLIICPMYNYVLYYNIEKSGFNAVSAYLLLHYCYTLRPCNWTCGTLMTCSTEHLWTPVQYRLICLTIYNYKKFQLITTMLKGIVPTILV